MLVRLTRRQVSIVLPQVLSGLHLYNQRKKERGEDHLLLTVSLLGWEDVCSCMVHPALSWHYGKISPGLRTMRVAQFEMSHIQLWQKF